MILSQPPYPVIPAHELFGALLMELGRPAEAREQFMQTLQRTPNCPKAIYGIAQATQAMGEQEMAKQHYEQFLALWKKADRDRPEVAAAKEFLAKIAPASQK